MTYSSPSTAASGLTSELVTAIDHVGIAVPDLDAAIAWYGEHLGMVNRTKRSTRSRASARPCSVPGPGAGATAIQLLAPLNDDPRSPSSSTAAAPACSSWPSASPISTRSARQLRADGVRLLYDAPRRGTADSRINFIHPKDGGGVLVELVEPAADGGH